MSGWLDSELTTLAFCWRLDRRDGVTLGFTSHDRDLTLDGLVCRATPGMMPSAVTRSEGFDVATLDVAGALTDDAITADDLSAGRWDGARVRLWAVDWTAPDASGADWAPLLLARGEIGDVGASRDGFTAELRGPTALLERPVVEATSPECRAALGDRRCGIDLAPLTRIAVVTAVEGAAVRVDAIEGSTNSYAYGRLRWLEGPNGGLSSDIAESAADGLTLREAPPFAVAAGVRVELMEGCDRRFETCVARFANAANFRGEPHLPGNDLLTRYPGA